MLWTTAFVGIIGILYLLVWLTKEAVGRQHQGIDRPGVRQVPEGSGEQEKNGENWLQNHLWCPNDPHG